MSKHWLEKTEVQVWTVAVGAISAGLYFINLKLSDTVVYTFATVPVLMAVLHVANRFRKEGGTNDRHA